ncbi:hypothetical protein ACA910_019751 [Epithemia clementina (nom. ined.)]
MGRNKTVSRNKTSQLDHSEDRSTTVPVEHTTSRVHNYTETDDVSTSLSDASLDSVSSQMDASGDVRVIDCSTRIEDDSIPVPGRHTASTPGISDRKRRHKSLVDDDLLPFDEEEESYAGSYHSNPVQQNSINVMSSISDIFACDSGIDLSKNANTTQKPISKKDDNDVTVHNLEEKVKLLQRQLDRLHRSLWHHKSEGKKLHEKILLLESCAPNDSVSTDNVKATPKKKISMNDCTEYANQFMHKMESYRCNGISESYLIVVR